MALGGSEAQARAKLNLFLHVGEKRADGFHPLQSLAVFADIADRLRAEAADELSLELEGPFAAPLKGRHNLVLDAATRLAEKCGKPAKAKLTLVKNLPVAAGIGGGSADAAAALRLLVKLWQVKLDDKSLREIALSLGSDVPVCLASRHTFMEGQGEVLTPIAVLPRLPLLLVNPGVQVSTKEIFAALGERRGVGMQLPAGGFGDLADLLRFLETNGNDLEAPALAKAPQIGEVLNILKRLPGALFTRMSGSGATCFALMPDEAGAARAALLLKEKHPDWWIAPALVPDMGIQRESASRDFGPTAQGL